MRGCGYRSFKRAVSSDKFSGIQLYFLNRIAYNEPSNEIGIDIAKGFIMIDNKRVKEILFGLGADLCGIASIDRFHDAPKGYHPTDVLPTCKSVISFGCRFPIGTLSCTSAVPYTRARNSITSKMDAMALDFCIEMENIKLLVYQFQQMKANGTIIQRDGALLFPKSMRHRLRDWVR